MVSPSGPVLVIGATGQQGAAVARELPGRDRAGWKPVSPSGELTGDSEET